MILSIFIWLEEGQAQNMLKVISSKQDRILALLEWGVLPLIGAPAKLAEDLYVMTDADRGAVSLDPNPLK